MLLKLQIYFLNIIVNEDFEELFPNIKINKFKSLKEVRKHIVKNILTPIRETDSSFTGKDCILLIGSTFLQGTYKGDEDLRERLIIKDVSELKEKNLGETTNKLRYTSILKYKGLEKKNVFLVISEPSEINKYELFVGITRAILNLEINIVK